MDTEQVCDVKNRIIGAVKPTTLPGILWMAKHLLFLEKRG